MSKSLITADLHIWHHRNEERRLRDGLECLKWIYRVAEETGCKRVIIAGDLFHNRFTLNVSGYANACQIIFDYWLRGIHTILLLGNHDMYFEDNWSVHTLVPIKEWATVIDKPCTLDFDGVPVDFLPYTPKPSNYLSDFKDKSTTLISHLAVAEALFHAKHDIVSVEDDSKEKEVISPKAFFGWKKVWLGHYHYGQRLDNIEYIGSPMQLTFGEAGQNKHVAIFDHDTLETKYVVNNLSPKFHIVESVDAIEKLDMADAYVQIRTEENIYAKFDLRNKLSKLGAREIEFVPTKMDLQEQTGQALSDISSFVNDHVKMISGYVDTIQTELKKDILRKVGIQIIKGE